MSQPTVELSRACKAALGRGDKIAAIKLVREELGLDLAGAKDWVEKLALAADNAHPPFSPHALNLSADAIAALNDGDRIAAIRHLRVATGIQLKDAKEGVDAYLATHPGVRAQFEERRAPLRRRFFARAVIIAAMIAAGLYLALR